LTSPYLLPDGNVQIAFSGGRTSGYMLRRILDANGSIPERAVVTFQNTSRERFETLDFVQEVGERFNVPITWLELRPAGPCPLVGGIAAKYEEIFGESRLAHMIEWWDQNRTPDRFAIVNHNSASRSSEVFEALILSRKYLPNQQMRFCTIEMKIRTAKRYLMSLGWKHWVNCVGFRADEPHRLNKPPPRDRWTVWAPLAVDGRGSHHVGEFWADQAFDLRLPNVSGNCWLGNCDGCFLKSEANVAAFTRDFPIDAVWWEKMEVFVSWLTNSASAAFWSKRYTRADIRQFMERQGDWALSTEGALCQKDDGECTVI
jgi:aromatic ring-cleaving dioxygenase